jgi:hypothetical protein
MKNIYFLIGLPRAGNTLLGSLLNQNKKISLTANTLLCDVIENIESLKNSLIFKNFPDHNSLDNVVKNIFNNYYNDWNAEHIIDRGPWGTPSNLQNLKKIINKPKFIILYRPVLEILASFVKIENPKNVEDACDDFMNMNKNSILLKNLWSIYNIIENKEKFLILHYKNLVEDTLTEIKKIYEFINVPYSETKLINFDKFNANNVSYDDSVLNANIHEIRTDNISFSKYDIKEVLSKNIIEKYSGLEIL